MPVRSILGAALAASLCSSGSSYAASDPHAHHGQHDHSGHHYGDTMLMGTHIHKQGDWMLSYRFMRMSMEDNRNGTSDVSPDTIVTTVANRFSALAGQPPTLRVVPTEMTTDMHMLGTMYGLSDGITLMAMLPYLEKEMDHVTYMGGTGTTVLGGFRTATSGIGDVRLKGLFRLHDDRTHHVHGIFGVSLPTGSNTETGAILTPMGATPTIRLPYPMQPGSGTYDIIAGLTYTAMTDAMSWGAQYEATLRTGSDEGYTLGDVHKLTAWLGTRLQSAIGVAGRLSYLNVDSIDGIDPNIVAPVQTADPDRQGRERIDLTLEMNVSVGDGHRIGFEISRPLYQDLDGPQLKSDLMFGVAYQKSF